MGCATFFVRLSYASDLGKRSVHLGGSRKAHDSPKRLRRTDMLALSSISTSSMVMTTPATTGGGRAFAETLPGITQPMGFFVRPLLAALRILSCHSHLHVHSHTMPRHLTLRCSLAGPAWLRR